MSSRSSSLNNLPPKQVALVVGLFMVVAAAIFYWLFYQGLEDKLSAKNRALTAELQKVSDLERTLADLKAIENEEAVIKRKLREIEKRLPRDEEEFHDFLRSIHIKAQNNSIDIKEFEKLEPLSESSLYDTVPIEMSFQSSYDAATNFFWDVSFMGEVSETAEVERIVNIKRLELRRNKDMDSGTIEVFCTAETYLCTSCEALAGGAPTK